MLYVGGGVGKSCSCADCTSVDDGDGSCGYGDCFRVEETAPGTGDDCDYSGVVEVVKSGGSVGSCGAEFVGEGSGGIGGGLSSAEGAGGCAAVVEVLKEPAVAALRLAVVVAVAMIGQMALAASTEASEVAAPATPVPAQGGRLRKQSAAEDNLAPKPLSGPTRKLWSRWTGHGVELKSRQMHCGSLALWSTFRCC